jgi:membrane protein DedA with SNARE-associated domain
MTDLAAGLDDWLATHADLAPLVVFLLTFLESLPGISLLVPATALLLGIGLLIGNGTLEPWSVVGGAIAGAVLGDAVGFWATRWFGAAAIRRRVPAAHRRAYARAVLLMRRWGWAAVFLGRFLGPLRAVVPAAAAVAGMRERSFQTANVASAVIWAPLMLLPGTAAGWSAGLLGDADDPLILLFAFLGAALAWVGARRALAALSVPRRLRRAAVPPRQI